MNDYDFYTNIANTAFSSMEKRLLLIHGIESNPDIANLLDFIVTVKSVKGYMLFHPRTIDELFVENLNMQDESYQSVVYDLLFETLLLLNEPMFDKKRLIEQIGILYSQWLPFTDEIIAEGLIIDYETVLQTLNAKQFLLSLYLVRFYLDVELIQRKY